MADVRSLSRTFWKIVVALAVLDLLALIVLISPISSSSAARRQNLNQLWNELQKKTRDAVPTRGIDKKLNQARSEITEFYAQHFPDSFAAIPDELGKLAREDNVQLDSANYKIEDTDLPDLRRVYISARISGDYTREAKFINSLERSNKVFFLVDSVDLNESGASRGAPGTTVALQIGVETYLKSPNKTATLAEMKTDEPRHAK
jgi:Tfp pilus assembly protein PilO